MKVYTEAELNEILRKHTLWLKNDPSGERANLSRANLSRANLSRADLSGANLSRANLSRADLSGADLSGADLSRANLSRANLSRANLSRANLSGANLSRAYLSGAYLSRAEDLKYPIACPEEGSFIGFKKCQNNLIVKLEIPEDALRCSASSRKCRCSKAKVISITNTDGSDAGVTEARAGYDTNFVYKIGEVVSVDNFDKNRWNECAPGIHFFITRQEAVDY